jgi:hypothetical protein
MMKVSETKVSNAFWARNGVLTVQDEHNRSEVERPLLVPEDHLTEIANITDLGMAHAEFPNHVRNKPWSSIQRKTYQVVNEV